MSDARRGRRRWWIGLLLTLAIALVAAACGAPDAALNGNAALGASPKGRILFAQNGDIYVWDNGSIKQLTKVGDASLARWSGDGSRFVFVRSGDAFSDLYVANADGSGMEQLTHNQPQLQPGSEAYVNNSIWALDPAWSPTGEDIAYVSDRGTAKNFLWLMSGLGADPVQVQASTQNGENVEHPSFSPDGTKVVFDQRTGGSDLQRWTQLWIADLNTGQLQPLLQSDQGTYDPAWSPDGHWVAYVGRNGTANDLWVIPAEGGTPIQLTSSGDVTQPVWSPDGSAIAFMQPDGSSFKVSYVDFSVDPNGAPKASKAHDLFKADAIDAVSGLSWAR